MLEKNLENSRKTQKMNERILNNIHILKLNILGCYTAVSRSSGEMRAVGGSGPTREGGVGSRGVPAGRGRPF
jgi:hypothetical protein